MPARESNPHLLSARQMPKPPGYKLPRIYHTVTNVLMDKVGSHGEHTGFDIKSLEKVQRRLARTCIPAPRGELEYSVRLEKLNLMSMCNRYTYLAISFVSKCLYGKYDVDPFDYISFNSRHKNTLKFLSHLCPY